MNVDIETTSKSRSSTYQKSSKFASRRPKKPLDDIPCYVQWVSQPSLWNNTTEDPLSPAAILQLVDVNFLPVKPSDAWSCDISLGLNQQDDTDWGGGSFLSGADTQKSDANGRFTFSALMVNVDGTYTLTATITPPGGSAELTTNGITSTPIIEYTEDNEQSNLKENQSKQQ